MSRFSNKLWFFRMARRLMPSVDAIRAVFRENEAQAVQVRLRFNGRRFKFRPGTSDFTCMEQVFLQEEYMFSEIGSPKVIVDAGANIGCTTLFFAGKFPDARIIAIEPDLSNFRLLEENCAGLTNVTLLNAALWDRAIRLSFADPDAEKWAMSVEEGDRGDLVEAVTVSDLLARYKLAQIDLLKMDIEGAEKEVFSDPSPLWLDRIGSIAIETHDRFKPGCSKAFYSTIIDRLLQQRVKGEVVLVTLGQPSN